MAKRFTNKKEVLKFWNSKIGQIKEIYDANKGKDDPGFYNSAGYKDLKMRRQRALNRYDKRDEISKKRKLSRDIKKEIDGGGFSKVSDVSVYEAFAGKGRIFEDNFIQKYNDGFLFEGVIYFNVAIKYFLNYADFRIEANRIIALLFNKEGDLYAPFTWRVRREYSVKGKKILFSYNFYKSSGEENEQSEDQQSE